jgi:adhesin/invasin
MIDTMARLRTMKKAAAAACMVLAALSAGCEGEGDPAAPEGSTISVSANPQTVIVPVGGAGATEITATVRSANGTRLPDQEITFSTTAGSLDPPAETPLKSDSNGQAKCLLTTSSAATVTAASGSISDMTQIQTAPGDLATFIINVVPSFIVNCNDSVMATATVNTTMGTPVQGLLVIFDEGSTSEITGNFSPAAQVATDVNGMAVATWTPNGAQCAAQCMAATADPNTGTDGDCRITLIADDITSSFTSPPAMVQDNIP